MNTIKQQGFKAPTFTTRDRSQFSATLRKNVNAYFKDKQLSSKGNSHSVIKSVAMLSLYLVPFLLMLVLPLQGWTVIPLSIIMGIGMAGIGMGVMHDAVHGSLSKKQWLNDLLGKSIYLLGGNRFNWKVQHNILHHTFTNIEGFDEDIEPKGALRLSKHTPLKKIHRFQHLYAFFFYCLMTISRLFRDFSQLVKYNKAGITQQQGCDPKKEMRILILSKVAYVILIFGLPLLFSSYTVGEIITGFVIMHLTGGLLMSVVFQMAHIVEEAVQPLPDEKGLIHNEWMIHELETTVNFAGNSRIMGWLVGGLNYQIEHHLFPNVCHVHYKAIAPIVKQTVKEFGLRYNENRTFLCAIGSHVRMLRALGKK